jgi:hypothetical protein
MGTLGESEIPLEDLEITDDYLSKSEFTAAQQEKEEDTEGDEKFDWLNESLFDD